MCPEEFIRTPRNPPKPQTHLHPSCFISISIKFNTSITILTKDDRTQTLPRQNQKRKHVHRRTSSLCLEYIGDNATDETVRGQYFNIYRLKGRHFDYLFAEEAAA